MHYIHIQDWIDRVADFALPSQAQLQASRSRKRPQCDFDFDLTTGLSSPPRSMNSPDFDTTPRAETSSKRRRVDIPSAAMPTPDLGHPSEDGRIRTPTPSIRSNITTTSTGTGKLTRQRSPVKNIADLELAEKSIRFTTPRIRGGVPDDVADLVEHIKAVSNRDGIIPHCMAEKVKKSLDLLDAPIHDRNTYAANQWIPDAEGQDGSITWDVADEFSVLQKIVAKTSQCDAEYLSEPSWNCTVHHPLLELALLPFCDSVSHWDVTKAPITKAYHPRHSSDEQPQVHRPY
ncbi:hypothetical protein G7046_g9957 [Stylonectria norvegica]|nr:hypothetical protein G7046_g9957 [Stylonectria norvegica]